MNTMWFSTVVHFLGKAGKQNTENEIFD